MNRSTRLCTPLVIFADIRYALYIMKRYFLRSIEDTQKFAHGWLARWHLAGREASPSSGSERAIVVGLSGHLGAGKTAFVKCVAKELGITQEITSPTYVIMKTYDIDGDFVAKNFGLNGSEEIPWKKLVHIDAYRLEKPEEIQVLDWEGLVSDKENIILIEWPENVGVDESQLSQKIEFDIQDDVHTIGFESFSGK